MIVVGVVVAVVVNKHGRKEYNQNHIYKCNEEKNMVV